ncbi:MAG: hypothetical protein ACFFCQ_01290 [Promethearchaeota archaeon]
MTKSKIEEIFSFIRFAAPDPEKYFVKFRDLDELVEMPALEFLEAMKTVPIPIHRIHIIRKGKDSIFVRYGCCSVCGTKLPKTENNDEFGLCQNPLCPNIVIT